MTIKWVVRGILKLFLNFNGKLGVGLLNAPPGSRLYQRMKKENRLLETGSGNNTDCSMNFIPKMDQQTLVNGYKHILNTIYSPKQYYMRAKTLLKEYKPQRKRKMGVFQLQFWHISSFIRCTWFLGIKDGGRLHYWKFLASTLLKRPRSFPLSMVLAVYGFHFRTVVREYTGARVEDVQMSIVCK